MAGSKHNETVEQMVAPNFAGSRWIIVILGLLIVVVAYLRMLTLQNPDLVKQVEQQPLPVLSTLPDFELIERSGKSVGLGDLRGKVWVADFFFTRCSGPCPRMSAEMANLQRAFRASSDDVQLVSISVDPDWDSSEVLTSYAKRYSADPKRWWFVTSDYETIQRLAIEGFKLGATDNILIHSEKFVLVDGLGRIRGYYDSDSEVTLQALRDDVNRLIRGGG